MSKLKFQQGDVLFYVNETLPKNITELKTDIVQEGEATGHAHRLYGDGYQLYEEPKTKTKYLKVVRPTELKHEEHHAFVIPPGEYRIGIVREYDHFTEEARQVAD